MTFHPSRFAAGLVLLLTLSTTAQAHKLRVRGEAVEVAGSSVTITPTGDWNSLSKKVGKYTETWTLDGESLNDVTFFVGVAPGNPLVKEKNKKRAPLPKFTSTTLLVEVPELLERTYRAYKNISSFQIISNNAGHFLGRDGVFFTYEFTDQDDITRQGEARAAIIGGQLYMMTFDAPRLNYFEAAAGDFRALADSAKLR